MSRSARRDMLSNGVTVTCSPPDFDRLLARSSDTVFVVGGDMRIVWWGTRAEQVLGISAPRVLGRRCFNVLAGSRAAGREICGPECPVAEALRRGETVRPFNFELCLAESSRRTFTLGFLVDESARFLTHVLRDPVLPGPGFSADDSTCLGALTPRQREVLRLLVSGASSAEIARRLAVTRVTARNHVQNVLTRLGVHSRLEAAALINRLTRGFQPNVVDDDH